MWHNCVAKCRIKNRIPTSILTKHPGFPVLTREIQGVYPESRDFSAKSRDLKSIYVVIDFHLTQLKRNVWIIYYKNLLNMSKY